MGTAPHRVGSIQFRKSFGGKGDVRHCAAMRSRKSWAMAWSGPGSGLMKMMRSLGWVFLALRRWMPRGILDGWDWEIE